MAQDGGIQINLQLDLRALAAAIQDRGSAVPSVFWNDSKKDFDPGQEMVPDGKGGMLRKPAQAKERRVDTGPGTRVTRTLIEEIAQEVFDRQQSKRTKNWAPPEDRPALTGDELEDELRMCEAFFSQRTERLLTTPVDEDGKVVDPNDRGTVREIPEVTLAEFASRAVANYHALLKAAVVLRSDLQIAISQLDVVESELGESVTRIEQSRGSFDVTAFGDSARSYVPGMAESRVELVVQSPTGALAAMLDRAWRNKAERFGYRSK